MSSTEQEFPFVHITFFALADRSRKTRARFVQKCHEHLSGYDGQSNFYVAVRATEEQRDVNDQNYNIEMHMVFETKAHYEVYKTHERHDLFITEVAGMSVGRVVFDYYIVEPATYTN